MAEMQQVAENLAKEWKQFKDENDRRLKEIESKGRADPLTEEKINKASDAIGLLQKQLDEFEKRSNRRGVGAASDEVAEAKAAHRKAYSGPGGYLRKGREEGLRDLEQKALQTTVDADGGYAIPEELERSVGAMERQLSPMLAEVSEITVGAETYEKLLANAMAGSGWVGETDARTETTSPTLASFKPSYGEVYAEPRATQKMLDDAFFDVEAWLQSEISEKFASDIDLAIISGNGTSKPKGILDYTLAQTADATRAYGTIEKMHSGSAGAFTAENLIDLVHKLRAGYRQNAKWLMAGTTVAYVRKLKDGDGRYLFQPSFLAGEPATILGKPIIEDDNMPVVAASVHAAAFGDFKRAYKVVNLRGIRVLRDPFTTKPYVKFYTTRRLGGGVEDTRAVKVLTLSA